MEDESHPIIARPWQYDLAEMHYSMGLDGSAPYIDLTLQRGEVKRRLRFTHPRDVQIEAGCFPQPTGGMEILDVRHRQMSDIGVRVGDFEATHGALTFWAKDVLDLDEAADA